MLCHEPTSDVLAASRSPCHSLSDSPLVLPAAFSYDSVPKPQCRAQVSGRTEVGLMARVILSSVVLVLLANPVSGQTRLQWKLHEGERFYLETTVRANQTLSLAGQQTKQEMENVTVVSFYVKSKGADGSLVIEQKIESIKSKAVGGTAPVGNIFRQMEGMVFTVTYNAKMEVTKFEGYGELIKKLGGDDPVVGKQIRSLLSEDSLKHSAEEAFRFLPDAAVKPGHKWDRKHTVPLGPLGSLNAVQGYTYDGPVEFEGKNAEKISVVTSVSYQPPKGDTTGLPFRITAGNLKTQDGKGTIYFDAAAGRMLQSETKWRLKGVLTFEAAQGQPMDMEMDQEQSVRIRVTAMNPLK